MKICGMELKYNRGKFIAMTLASTLQNQKKSDKGNLKKAQDKKIRKIRMEIH